MYVNTFSSVFEKIRSDKLRSFAVDSVNRIPDDSLNESDVRYIQKVIQILILMAKELDVDDIVVDLLIVVGLLHRFGFDPTDPLHHLRVRSELEDLMGAIGRDLFNDIMLTIESQYGLRSPIPQVAPKGEDTVFVWLLPLSIRIAKADLETPL